MRRASYATPLDRGVGQFGAVMVNDLCCLNTKAIAAARAKMGGELSALERAALDYVETCAMKPELRFEFMLEPGDISMMNNYSVLHNRTDQDLIAAGR